MECPGPFRTETPPHFRRALVIIRAATPIINPATERRALPALVAALIAWSTLLRLSKIQALCYRLGGARGGRKQALVGCGRLRHRSGLQTS